MNKFRCSMLAAYAVALSAFLFFSCSKEDEKPSPEVKTGVYKVEVSFLGDIENYQPMLFIGASYLPGELDTPLFSGDGTTLSTGIVGYGFNYNETPTVFAKPIICYTSNKGRGISLSLFSGYSDVTSSSPRIQVVYRGYLDDKLIKSEIKEVVANSKNTLGYVYYVKIGDEWNPKEILND